MSEVTHGGVLAAAIDDFRQMRRRADMEQLVARLQGRSVDLLPFDEVQQRLRATLAGARHLEDIRLDAIVGSVGRYSDFTRSFLPRQDSDADRWTRVLIAAEQGKGLPPIEVYQIGEVYFVVDGNHRVSVARQHGSDTIQAYVTRFATRVPLTADITPEQLIVREEYADFLDQTMLDDSRPEANLLLTEAGQYATLLEHIQVHRYFLIQERGQEVGLPEAAASWYDRVYTPMAELVRERGVLQEFPSRTEADLYVWLSRHRADLEAQLGWEVSHTTALRALTLPVPVPAAPTPAAGGQQWADGKGRALFRDLLVAVNGEYQGWEALEQALEVARREGGRLYGLHVVPTRAQREGEAARTVQAEFDARCAAAGVAGRLAIEVGPVAQAVVERSRWADLVVLRVAYPPAPQPIARLKSGLRAIIRRSLRPVLAVPRPCAPMSRALVAFDGSPKSQEALFAATYLAGRWGLELAVVSADDGRAARHSEEARAYLARRGVSAEVATIHGPPGQAILDAARQRGSDLIVMGGYSAAPVADLVLGSVVEEVLRAGLAPVLICQ